LGCQPNLVKTPFFLKHFLFCSFFLFPSF
jgi:hypothetical protein